MVKAPRVTGSRDAPNLPKLSPSDFSKPGLWDAATKGSWNLEEAAHFVNEKGVVEPIDPRASNLVSKTYVWLKKEYEQGKLYPAYVEPPLFTPGTIMRHLWEARIHVSLKMWALYTHAERGESDLGLQNAIFRKNYETAAKIIRDVYPNETKADIITFLLTLPENIEAKNGSPVFMLYSRAYFNDILKTKDGRKGRPPKGHVSLLLQEEEKAREMIKKKMGY